MEKKLKNLKGNKQGLKKVNIIVGRFQPPTLGHIKVINELYLQNNYPVIVFIVRGKLYKPEKNPFQYELVDEMFDALINEYDFIESLKIIPSASIESIFNELRPKYEPVLWGLGTDRLKDYNRQVISYRDELNCLDEFSTFEISRDEDDISSTKVRTFLIENDEKSFKKMMPKSIQKFYILLKTRLKEV